MVQPTDYTIKTVDPTETFTKTLGMYQGLEQNQQSIEANKLTLEAARQKIEADKAGQERLQQVGVLINKAISPGATIDDVQNAMVYSTNQQQFEGLQSKFAAMSLETKKAIMIPALQTYSAALSGDLGLAEKMLNDRAVALENSGDTTAAAQNRALAATIKDDKGATVMAYLGGMLSADTDFGRPGVTSLLAQAKAPAEIKAGRATAESAVSQAKIDSITLQYAPETARLAIKAAKKGIELTDVQISEIEQRTKSAKEESDRLLLGSPVKLTAASQRTLNDMVEDSVGKMTVANSYMSYASRLDNSGLMGGLLGSTNKFLEDLGGKPNLLRTEGKQYINSAIVNALPKGSASDADIKITTGGFPNNGNAKTMASYFRGAAVIEGFRAQQLANRSEWLAMNGTMGPATRPMVIGGRQVKAGETLIKYQSRSAKQDLDEVTAQLGIVAPKNDGKQGGAASGGKTPRVTVSNWPGAK